ncbi:ATP-binding protein [soil metagenome]
MRSLRRNLQVWMLSALALGGIVMVVVSYQATLEEMGEQFDANLQQVALAIAEHHAFGTEYKPRLRNDLPRLPKVFEEDGDFDLVTSTHAADGRLTFTSDPRLTFPQPLETGLTDIDANGERWRVYTLVTPQGSVDVAQRWSVRSLLAAATAFRIALPPLFLIAFMVFVVGVGLKRGLRPFDHLTAEIEARNPDSLEPVGSLGGLAEIAALTSAMNGLIGRLGAALETQRRFTADAAHELRTPITALRLQLQLVRSSDDAAQREASMQKLRAGIDRAQRVVEQLLALSRLEPGLQRPEEDVIDLAELVRASVVEFELQARHRGVDLGADADSGVQVRGNRDELSILVGNLVDNALRYSPAGSVVDVRAAVHEGAPLLEVVDTGPGIAQGERTRVFDRFFRGAGSSGEPGTGLGLSIVRTLVDRHDAQIVLDDNPSGHGLRASVRFEPLAQI